MQINGIFHKRPIRNGSARPGSSPLDESHIVRSSRRIAIRQISHQEEPAYNRGPASASADTSPKPASLGYTSMRDTAMTAAGVLHNMDHLYPLSLGVRARANQLFAHFSLPSPSKSRSSSSASETGAGCNDDSLPLVPHSESDENLLYEIFMEERSIMQQAIESSPVYHLLTTYYSCFFANNYDCEIHLEK